MPLMDKLTGSAGLLYSSIISSNILSMSLWFIDAGVYHQIPTGRVSSLALGGRVGIIMLRASSNFLGTSTSNSEFEFEICPALTWTRSADPVIFGIDFRIPIVSGSSLNNFPLLLMGMVGYTFK